MSKEIDCEYTDDLVCPHCWYVEEWNWDIYENSTEWTWECWECGKEFKRNVDFSVSFSSEKIK